MLATMDLAEHARSIIDGNRYVTLATVDADGLPWATPVYFATADYRDFYWCSDPLARHSRNLGVRPSVSMVVFDSTVPAYTGEAVYMSASATELSGDELEEGLRVFPGPAWRGGSPVTVADVTPPAPYRFYRARATAYSVLCPRERGLPCTLHGSAVDHRADLDHLS